MKKHLLTNSKSRGGITKLNSNAFTLIELLAIIVILAIIAVITVPIILNIIENSRKGAASDSAYGYKDSVNKFYIAELQNHNKLKLDGTYTVKSDGSLEPTTDNTFGFGDSEYGDSLDVQVAGTIPSSGKLRYSNNVLNAGCVVIGDYKVTFGTDGKVDGTVKGNCSDYEFPSVSSTSSVWNDYYYVDSNGTMLNTSTFDNSWKYWAQGNIETGEQEICALFANNANGVICVAPDSVLSTDFGSKDSSNNYIVTGNTAEKVSQMESLGASCTIDQYSINCSGNDVIIQIASDGGSYSGDSNHYLWISKGEYYEPLLDY